LEAASGAQAARQRVDQQRNLTRSQSEGTDTKAAAPKGQYDHTVGHGIVMPRDPQRTVAATRIEEHLAMRGQRRHVRHASMMPPIGRRKKHFTLSIRCDHAMYPLSSS
jgi:hypothetical protein